MSIYIEYAVIDNLVIDYFLLEATFFTFRKPVKKARLFLLSILGTIIAIVYPLINAHAIIIVSIKVLTGLLLPLLAVKYQSLKEYFICTAIFFGYTFLTGGGIYAIYSLFNVKLTEIPVAICFVPAFFIIKFLTRVVSYVFKKSKITKFTYKVELTFNKKTVECVGFLDTGNGVYDNNNPVIVCGKTFFKQFIDGDFYKIKSKKILSQTVNGCAENLAFEIEQIKIYNGKDVHISNNVTLMVVKNVGDGYQLILHPALIKESYEDYSKIKKVS